METIQKTKNGDVLTGLDRRYDNAHDASMRLSNTVLRYRGIPVYASEFDGSVQFLGRPLVPSKYETEFWVIDANDSNLDISSIPLGFINQKTRNEPVYALRGASRSQRQGVDVNRLSYYSPKKGDFTSVSPTKEFMLSLGDTLRGTFYNWSDCIEEGGAMSRVWAMVPKTSGLNLLYHKHSPVGIFNKKENKLSLSEEYMNPFFLRFVTEVLTNNAKEDVRVVKF